MAAASAFACASRTPGSGVPDGAADGFGVVNLLLLFDDFNMVGAFPRDVKLEQKGPIRMGVGRVPTLPFELLVVLVPARVDGQAIAVQLTLHEGVADLVEKGMEGIHRVAILYIDKDVDVFVSEFELGGVVEVDGDQRFARRSVDTLERVEGFDLFLDLCDALFESGLEDGITFRWDGVVGGHVSLLNAERLAPKGDDVALAGGGAAG